MTERPDGHAAHAVQKSADAYRTISEVADDLDLPQHVLRFWETRFPQVKPLKRAGGRRFYRPDDVALLRAVRALLYDEGYTIKGVQRLLAEHGARPVAEALARSRVAAPTKAEQAHRAERVDPAVRVGPGGDGVGRGPERHPSAPHEPAVARFRSADARDAAPPPDPTTERVDLAERIDAILDDLVECARLLASVRST